MSRTKKTIFFFLLAIFLISAAGCKDNNSDVNNYGLEEFIAELKAKNYDFTLKEVGKNFLPTTRKRISIGDEAIDVYVFKNNKGMEKEAAKIEPSGFGYQSKTKAVKVSWISVPHFYKKGRIIVQYIGENEKIIADLKEILGPQFAGLN